MKGPRLPTVDDVVTGKAPLAYVSEADYHWLKYPRSGFSYLGMTCFGLALGFGSTIISRHVAAKLDSSPEASEPTWEYVALVISVVAGIVFWIVGRYTSKPVVGRQPSAVNIGCHNHFLPSGSKTALSLLRTLRVCIQILRCVQQQT
jgi:hypothetical protein